MSNPNPKFSHHLFPLFCLFLFHHCNSSDLTFPPVKLQPYDRSILLLIQKHFGGPKSGFWNSSSPECCNYCYDQPVRCDDDGHVEGLVLSSGPHLSGSIPSSISQLTFLRDLSLDGLGFSGRIPPSIGNLKYLQFIAIVNTSMSGPIPDSLGRLKNLTRLNLSNNKFSGSIPDSLGQLTNMWELDLSSNMLSEPIPDSIGHLIGLSNLLLNSNRLSGSIPASLCQLKNINELSLSKNRFTGSIPDCFGSFKNQIDLWLNENQLAGSVPESMGKASFWTLDLSNNKLTDASVLFHKNNNSGVCNLYVSNNLLRFDMSNVEFSEQYLNRLNISHNMIYGSLPEQLAHLPLLVSIDVSYNQLCGPIPRSRVLKRLKPVNYAHNKCLCGAPLHPCKK